MGNKVEHLPGVLSMNDGDGVLLLQTIIDAVKRIWGIDYMIAETGSIVLLLFCFGVSKQIARKSIGPAYDAVNKHEKELLKKQEGYSFQAGKHSKICVVKRPGKADAV